MIAKTSRRVKRPAPIPVVRLWHQAVDLGGLSLVLATDTNAPPSEKQLDEAVLLLQTVVALRRRRRELGLADPNIPAGDRLRGGA